jgi:hypothetical protein
MILNHFVEKPIEIDILVKQIKLELDWIVKKERN